MFGNKEEKQNRKKAEAELNKFINKKGIILEGTLKFRQTLPLYNVFEVTKRETKFMKKVDDTIRKEIKNKGLQAEEVENRIMELFAQEYGEPITQEEANKKAEDLRLGPIAKKEKKLEEKFGVPFCGRKWFSATIEEIKAGTITNNQYRQVDTAYVFVEDDCLEIIKESVFIKSKMGTRKIYYDNIASIDYDARGRLHLSNSLVINLKSLDKVIIKIIDEKAVTVIQYTFNEFMNNKHSNMDKSFSNADELLKYAELLEKGLLTKEEFEKKKKELL